jgi:hypothetical protein
MSKAKIDTPLARLCDGHLDHIAKAIKAAYWIGAAEAAQPNTKKSGHKPAK